MPDYTGGYTSSLDSASRRGVEDAQRRQLLQALVEQQQLFQQQQQERQRQMQGRRVIEQLLPQIAQLQAPPGADAGAQPPPPGQPSFPMMPPPAQGAAPGMPPAAAPMPPPQGGMPSPPPAASGPPPPGPGAPMAKAAGPGAPPSPPGAPAAAAGAPPAGAAPPMPPQGWQGLPKPPAPAQGGPGGIAPPPEDAVMPRQQLSVGELAKFLSSKGIKGEEALAAIEQWKPYMDDQNKQELNAMKVQMTAQSNAMKAYESTIRALTGKQTADERGRHDKATEAAATERNALLRQRLAKADSQGTNAEVDPEERQSLAAQAATGQPLTQVVPGWGKQAAALRQKVRADSIKQIMQDEGISAAEAGRELAQRTVDFGAGKVALNQITKDLASIRPFKEMLDKNASILVKLADKVVKTDSQLANRPINWLQSNMGDNPDVGEFLAQMRIFQTEAARVLNNPRLVGALTDSARHELEEIINGNMPIGMTKAIIGRLQGDGDNRVKSMEDERRRLRSDIGQGGSGGDAPPAGVPAGSKRIGFTPDGKQPVWQSPDGKKWVE